MIWFKSKEKMTPETCEELNRVLNYLYYHGGNPDEDRSAHNMYLQLQMKFQSLLFLYTKKLKDDGYIIQKGEEIRSEREDKYHYMYFALTREGVTFFNRGGYKTDRLSQSELEEIEKEEHKARERRNAKFGLVTFILAVIGTLFAVLAYYK